MEVGCACILFCRGLIYGLATWRHKLRIELVPFRNCPLRYTECSFPPKRFVNSRCTEKEGASFLPYKYGKADQILLLSDNRSVSARFSAVFSCLTTTTTTASSLSSMPRRQETRRTLRSVLHVTADAFAFWSTSIALTSTNWYV